MDTSLSFALQHRPIQDWLPYRQDYLDEILRHDGRKGATTDDCSSIGCVNPGRFICRDCFHANPYCQHCLLQQHHNLPLHRILVSSR
jgi:hypothetical protein